MNAVAERPKRTNFVRLVQPPAGEWVFASRAPEARTLVTQDAEGLWRFNGRVVNAERLRRDDGKERAQALAHEVAAVLAAASPSERERMLAIAAAGFNSIEELFL